MNTPTNLSATPSPADIYLYCFFGCFLVFFISRNIIPHVIPTLRTLILLPAQAIGYYFLVNRYALIGPITIASAFFQVIYIGGNVISLVYEVDSITQAASRAGTLSLVNLMPVYLTMHLSFLADIFGVSLHTYQQIHRLCGLIAMCHVLFHGGVALTHHSRLTAEMPTTDWYPLIGAAAMILLILLSVPFFRRRLYEAFLWLHQLLAISTVVFIISHLISIEKYQWTPMYIFAGLFCSLEIFYLVSILYHNLRAGKRSPRFHAKYYNDNVIIATITLSRPLRINPGQYINIWVPSLSLFSSHPFTVISWAPSPQKHINLLIKPRRGFTQKLFYRLSNKENRDINTRVLFSGPHGISAPVWEFDYVLLFATGFGIATMLPYLTKLVEGSKGRESKAKKVHLVWQVNSLELREAVGDVINPLFKDDDDQTLSNILYLSIYNGLKMEKESSERGHYTINPGKANVASIIKTESTYIAENSKTIVLVSATGDVRDHVRKAIRGFLSKGFKLKELDYQP